VTVDVDTSSTNGSLKAGDILTCKSDGYPQPSYTWTDDNGEIVASGPNITLSRTYEKLTCTASSDFSTPCSQWKTRYNVTLGTFDISYIADVVNLLLLLMLKHYHSIINCRGSD